MGGHSISSLSILPLVSEYENEQETGGQKNALDSELESPGLGPALKPSEASICHL